MTNQDSILTGLSLKCPPWEFYKHNSMGVLITLERFFTAVHICMFHCQASLLYFTDMIHCHASLLTFTDMFHCHASLLTFTDMIHCHASLLFLIIWFTVMLLLYFTDIIHCHASLLYFSDMMHCHDSLLYFSDMIHFTCSSTQKQKKM